MFAFLLALSKKLQIKLQIISKNKIKHCLIETNSFLIGEYGNTLSFEVSENRDVEGIGVV